VIRKEFSTKSFKRSFTVDEKIEASNISAAYENGILNIGLPKKEQAKAIIKEINIQ
jgi:HSP20 family protein